MSNRIGIATALALAALLVTVRPLVAQQCRGDTAPATVVRGVVLDRETRVPLQDAEVRVRWTERRRERTHTVRTDSLGGY